MAQSKRWCFTLNNYTQGEYDLLCDALENCKYGVVGKEIAETGTPHLQGFCIFDTNRRLNAVRRYLGLRGHYEAARGTSEQASTYCKKGGDFREFGSLPNQGGKRNDISSFVRWVSDVDGRARSEREIMLEYPALYMRYRGSCLRMAELLAPTPQQQPGELREWQRELECDLLDEPDDRSVRFVIDEEGGRGKSWFIRYMLTKYPDLTQRLSVGKRDDLAYAIDTSKRMMLFDVPRECMKYLQYSILEGLKDGFLFSGKYASSCKFFYHKVHVYVFCNEEPDYEKLSMDRFDVVKLNEANY